MEKQDIVNWLERNKTFLSIRSIEKEVGVPTSYIYFYILKNKPYPKYSFRRDYVPYDEFVRRVGEVIKRIRAF